jgi:phosphoenolpyruvate-protein kinase (PTS system EI component)
LLFIISPPIHIPWILGEIAAAIVTHLGATLSHAAIVARELRIPAVVSYGDATLRFKIDDWIRFNGGQGLVEILEFVNRPDG